MVGALRLLVQYRELLGILAWKDVSLRYKQAYLGIAWAVIKPLTLMLIFTLLRSFVPIESGGVPYPVLAFAALLPWTLFQDATATGVNSVVGNAHLIRKIYVPREIFPIAAVLTKLIEFAINLAILVLMMWYFSIPASGRMIWVPFLIAYTAIFALAVTLLGAALNVYLRDITNLIPLLLSVMMYASPIIYPLDVVRQKLLVHQAAGAWSDWLYRLYTINPLAGIVDAFQRVLLRGLPPDWDALWPGLVLTSALLPLGYTVFKRAEGWFADVI